MTFAFRAHKPRAYVWFGISLLLIVLINAIIIQSFQSILLDWNSLVQQSVILIVPWILFLFLPSVFTGLIIYYSLSKNYRFIIDASGLTIQPIRSRNDGGNQSKRYAWNELTDFRFSDFEDNEYFTLVFREPANNIILHRETGDFEAFFEALKQHVQFPLQPAGQKK